MKSASLIACAIIWLTSFYVKSDVENSTIPAKQSKRDQRKWKIFEDSFENFYTSVVKASVEKVYSLANMTFTFGSEDPKQPFTMVHYCLYPLTLERFKTAIAASNIIRSAGHRYIFLYWMPLSSIDQTVRRLYDQDVAMLQDYFSAEDVIAVDKDSIQKVFGPYTPQLLEHVELSSSSSYSRSVLVDSLALYCYFVDTANKSCSGKNEERFMWMVDVGVLWVGNLAKALMRWDADGASSVLSSTSKTADESNATASGVAEEIDSKHTDGDKGRISSNLNIDFAAPGCIREMDFKVEDFDGNLDVKQLSTTDNLSFDGKHGIINLTFNRLIRALQSIRQNFRLRSQSILGGLRRLVPLRLRQLPRERIGDSNSIDFGVRSTTDRRAFAGKRSERNRLQHARKSRKQKSAPWVDVEGDSEMDVILDTVVCLSEISRYSLGMLQLMAQELSLDSTPIPSKATLDVNSNLTNTPNQSDSPEPVIMTMVNAATLASRRRGNLTDLLDRGLHEGLLATDFAPVLPVQPTTTPESLESADASDNASSNSNDEINDEHAKRSLDSDTEASREEDDDLADSGDGDLSTALAEPLVDALGRLSEFIATELNMLFENDAAWNWRENLGEALRGHCGNLLSQAGGTRQTRCAEFLHQANFATQHSVRGELSRALDKLRTLSPESTLPLLFPSRPGILFRNLSVL